MPLPAGARPILFSTPWGRRTDPDAWFMTRCWADRGSGSPTQRVQRCGASVPPDADHIGLCDTHRKRYAKVK